MKSENAVRSGLRSNETPGGFLQRIKGVISRRNIPPQYHEDLAQDIYLHFMKYPNSKQRIWQVAYDILRAQQGRGDNRRVYVEFDWRHEKVIPAAQTSSDAHSDFSALYPVGRDRIALLLYHFYGFELYEIGWMLGLTESRISLIVKAARKKGIQQDEISKTVHASRSTIGLRGARA